MNDTAALPKPCEIAQVRSAKRLSNLFLILVLLVGVLLIFLEPPLCGPDENTHFLNICRISHGGIFADVEDGVVGVWVSRGELDFWSSCSDTYYAKWIAEENTAPYSFAEMKTLATQAASEEMVFFPTHHATVNPIPYLLPALAVGFVRLFTPVNAFFALLIAKLANLLFYAFVMRLAIRKTGAFANTMFLLALMPMSVFQAASASYDAMLIPASFLLFAYVTSLLRKPEGERVGWQDVLGVCFAFACIVGTKIAYAPLVLALLAIPVKIFGGWKRWGICVGAVCLTGAVFWGIPTVATALITQDVQTVLSPAQLEQQDFFAAHFYRFPLIPIITLARFFVGWVRGFLGILGWLDTPFPIYLYFVFFLLLLATAAFESCRMGKITKRERWLAFGGVAIFYVGTVYEMYVSWNPVLTGLVGGWIAYGGQGRYFIPVALFLLLTLSNSLFSKLPKQWQARSEAMMRYLPTASAGVFLLSTVLLLSLRYWG